MRRLDPFALAMVAELIFAIALIGIAGYFLTQLLLDAVWWAAGLFGWFLEAA